VKQVILVLEPIPMHTVPTGLSSVPPVGPAIPLIEIEKSDPLFLKAPSAISFTTLSLTAPSAKSVSLVTPRVFNFALFEYVIKPKPYQFELPGMPVNSFPTQPPVQDSAVETLFFVSVYS